MVLLLAPLGLLGLPLCGATRGGEADQPTADEDVTAPDADAADSRAVPACNPVPAADPSSWHTTAVGYEIFVRSFYDSDGDGIGDLKGVTEKLDYLNDGDPACNSDLGVTLLWLMPTFPSPSYHGYDVTDYLGVNAQYGTMEDLRALVEAAHKRGIRVLLDLVMNHSSSKHPWFSAAADPKDPKRSWYVWSDKELHWPRPWGGGECWHKLGKAWYYGLFSASMPDLNYAQPAVRDEMTKAALFWLDEAGVDGYRLDAVRYLVETGPGEGQQEAGETFAFWNELAGKIRAQHAQALLLGEAWVGNAVAAKYYGEGKGLSMTLDFDRMESIVGGLKGETLADVEATLCAFAGQFPAGSRTATFLSNHDLIRVIDRLGRDMAKMRLAALLLFTLPGLPFVYYGDEIGMTNGTQLADEHKRLPMQWNGDAHAGFTTGKPWIKVNGDFAAVNVAREDKDPGSLLSWYRTLIRLRETHPALQAGGLEMRAATSKTNGSLFAFERTSGAERLVVVVNPTAAAALEASVKIPQADGLRGEPRLPSPAGPPATVTSGRLALGDLAPMSAVVLIVN
jgi:glycosidase